MYRRIQSTDLSLLAQMTNERERERKREKVGFFYFTKKRNKTGLLFKRIVAVHPMDFVLEIEKKTNRIILFFFSVYLFVFPT